MTKSELITALAERQPNLQKDDVEAEVNCKLYAGANGRCPIQRRAY
jgi:nucleoid DNA-binding protein